jgi:hypothetical protein
MSAMVIISTTITNTIIIIIIINIIIIGARDLTIRVPVPRPCVATWFSSRNCTQSQQRGTELSGESGL